MAKKKELEIVCRTVLSLLANALAGSQQMNANVINLLSVKKKSTRKNIKTQFKELRLPETE